MKKTQVVNLKHSSPAALLHAIYMGRAGRGETGYFGSPIVMGKPCPECQLTHRDAGSTIPCYTKVFYRRMKDDLLFRQRVLQLRGHTLACFCVNPDGSGPCHAKVIAEFLDKLDDFEWAEAKTEVYTLLLERGLR